MKLYLSSFRLGNNPERLANMISGNKRIAVIANSVDYETEEIRSEKLKITKDSLKAIGLYPEELDLRKYFDNSNKLKLKLDKYDGVLVRGGNVFILRKAFRKSGFDEIVKDKIKNDPKFVYAGYSAGGCVLSPNLHGFELCDEPNIKVKGYEDIDIIWEGLGILDYTFVPHYKSDNPDSELIDKTVKYLIDNGIKYKTLSDGEVIIIK